MEGEVNFLIEALNKCCPYFQPLVLPSYIKIKTLADVVSTEAQKGALNSWLPSNGNNIAMHININYSQSKLVIHHLSSCSELDLKLKSLEEAMLMMISGDEHELQIHIQRFLELNGKQTDKSEGHYLFQEAYNVAYAVKISLR